MKEAALQHNIMYKCTYKQPNKQQQHRAAKLQKKETQKRQVISKIKQ